MHPKTRARRGALAALIDIEKNEAILNAALERDGMPAESFPFAREIATGVLRHRALLDYTLEPLLKKPLGKLDAPVRAALRLAAYERVFLHTMAPAVANEYVESIRAARLASAVGFVNAIARRLPDKPREVPASMPAARRLATLYSHPEWLVQRWLNRWGEDECTELLQANNAIAPLSLRINTLRGNRDEIRQSLSERGLDVRESRWAVDGLLATDAGSPLPWPEWKAGTIIAQDEAAQLVGAFANPVPGSFVIDAAAAPGGKATHLAQLMNNRGRILALDKAPGRIKLVRENAERLGITIVESRSTDFRTEAPKILAENGEADLLLLDAPCLGTGTLRRRPDAKWKKTPEGLAELVQLQSELLDAAATLVKVGGALVYSTCSLEPEENLGAATAFLQCHPNFASAGPEAGWFMDVTQKSVIDSDGTMQILPQRHGCDGAFAIRLQRRD